MRAIILCVLNWKRLSLLRHIKIHFSIVHDVQLSEVRSVEEVMLHEDYGGKEEDKLDRLDVGFRHSDIVLHDVPNEYW